MHTLTALYFRQDITTPWFREYCLANGNSIYNDYIQTEFIDSGLMSEFNRTESEDKSILTTEIKLSDSGLEKWLSDSIVLESRAALFKYNEENNIILIQFDIN